MRKILVLAGLILLIGGGYVAWRVLYPPLSDTEQVRANTLDIASAVEETDGRRVANYLAPEFKWQSWGRDEVRGGLSRAGVLWRDVDVNLGGLQVDVQGERATSEGTFILRYKPRNQSPETASGRFKLQWEKRDGEWLITQAEGGENITP